jgi:glycosyltransferase involved in cell wall biosynthesis
MNMKETGATILYVWDADYPWDIRTEKICAALTAAGFDVHIVARNRKRQSLTERLPEATVHRMPVWSLAGPFDAALGFPAFFSPRWRRLISNTARDVHANLIIVRDLPLCPTAIRAARQQRIPVILDMAEHYPAIMRAIRETGRQKAFDWIVRNPALVERVEKYSIHNVDHILTVADEMSNRLVSMDVDRNRITRVGNTPKIMRGADIHEAPKRDSETIQVVYLGLLEVVRGIGDLIDAVALLRDKTPRVRLLLIGSGRDEGLFRNLATSKGLTNDDVEFAGFVPYANAIKLVAAADIGVLPLHRNEHMDTTEPNKLFDYMSVGIPVVTSDSIPSARIISAEGAGVVYESRNVGALAKAIYSLRDPQKRRDMGRRGRTAIERQYNWARDSLALIRAVERVLSETPATSCSP